MYQNNLYPYFFNQNRYRINRENISKQKEGSRDFRPYFYVYQDNVFRAMRELDGTSFKVYMALLSNADGFTLDYSPQYVSNITGMSKDSARQAIIKMERKGYVDKSAQNTKDGIYNFYENPHMGENKITFTDDFSY